jgi:hypothetical protein
MAPTVSTTSLTEPEPPELPEPPPEPEPLPEPLSLEPTGLASWTLSLLELEESEESERLPKRASAVPAVKSRLDARDVHSSCLRVGTRVLRSGKKWGARG